MIDGYDRKKFLYVPITGSSNDILWGLLEMELNVDCYPNVMPVSLFDENQLEELIFKVRFSDVVISQQFSVVVAEACHQTGKMYISWIWDLIKSK